jgi:hypothetical protein
MASHGPGIAQALSDRMLLKSVTVRAGQLEVVLGLP